MRLWKQLLVTLLPSIVFSKETIRRTSSVNGTYFPFDDGFPNPGPDAIIEIQKQSHGILPNGPLPETLSTEGITNIKLIALNEIFEVAFVCDPKSYKQVMH